MTFSKRRKIRAAILVRLLTVCILTLAASDVRADLTAKQARKLITRMPGFELTNDSVRVKTISPGSAGTTEVSAEIRAVFRFEQNKEGRWRVVEIRTAQDRWEEIDLIASALKMEVVENECAASDPPFKGVLAIDPSVKRARCLLGSLLGVEVPSDAVRIQEIDPMPIPLASQPSATVVAWVKVDARLLNDKAGWRVAELRTGTRDWVKLEPVVAAVNEMKQKQARAELESIARALEQFRKERGFYVVSDKQSVVIDHLNPRYLPRVIRVDPWHKPYEYQGERDHFILRSAGPDGKDNTADDIELASLAR